MMNAVATVLSPIETEARALLVNYVYAIDEGPLSSWPTFFCDPGLYRITTRENELRGFPLSIMLCDNHKMLYDRVEAIEKAKIKVESANLTMIPKNMTAVDVDTGRAVVKLIEALEDHDDVQNVVTNADIPDEVIKVLA